MPFGKAFRTQKEATAHLKKLKDMGAAGIEIRKMSKKLHPRRKKLFHVGTYLDWLNFA